MELSKPKQDVIERLKSEIRRRGGWILSRVEVPLEVAKVLREEGLLVPGKLINCTVEENLSDPSGTRYVFRCLEHSRENCPACLGTEKSK